MFCWRITKYNPLYRDHSGKYIENTWTSSSDIHQMFEHHELTIEQYMTTENAYIYAILSIFDCISLPTLTISQLEKHECTSMALPYDPDMISLYDRIYPGYEATRHDVELLARLALRENIWCTLDNAHMFVHFGYDYYMYIGSTKKCCDAINAIEKLGLFVEPITLSPYAKK